MKPSQTCALRVTLQRDLSQKYHKYEQEAPSVADRYESLPQFDKDGWDVAGPFDFMKALPLESFVDIGKPKNSKEVLSWQTEKDLVLLPFTDSVLPDWTEHLCKPTPENSMAVLWKITLSPAAHEITIDYRSIPAVLQSTRDLANSLLGELPFNEWGIFRCLGGPDLVILFMPKNPIDLQSIHSAMQEVKSLPLVAIRDQMDKATLTQADNDRMLPGHALVRLEPTFCFQQAALHEYSSELFRTQEKATGLRLISRLRVDCGHEDSVVRDLRATCERHNVSRHGVRCQPIAFDPIRDALNEAINEEMAPDALVTRIKNLLDEDESASKETWNEYTIEVSIGSIADFVNIWKDCYYKRTWRNANLLSSETALCFHNSGETANDCDAAWQINSNIHSLLDGIGNSIRRYSASYLSDTQREELIHVYNSFRSCSFRMELLTTARDLFPFFKQLGAALSQGEWHNYLNPTAVEEERRSPIWRDEHTETVAALGLGIHRAVRNRIEQRSMLADPPLAHTLQYGASKLISAYSGVFWLCSELFRSPNRRVDPFAGCVVAGGSGYIQCRELFTSFRTEYEAKKQQQLSENKTDGSWNSRLLLLDISGETLFEPESCFVHCLHEMAEVSEWIELPETMGVRHIVNTWIVSELGSNLYGVLVTDFDMPEDDAVNRYCADFCAFCIAAKIAGNTGTSRPSAPDDVKTAIGDWIWNPTPESFIDFATDAVREIGARPGTLNEAAACASEKNAKLPADHELVFQALASPEFQATLDRIKALAVEVVADTGMWAALDSIRMHVSGSRTPAARFKDLARIYTGMLRLSESPTGQPNALQSKRESILRRWSIQVASLNSKAHPVKSIEIAIAEADIGINANEAQVLVADACAFPLTCDATANNSLPGGLRELACYGGEHEAGSLITPDAATYNEADGDLVSLILEAWDEKNQETLSRKRIELAMTLWARALFLGKDRFLVTMGDTEQGGPTS